MADTQNNINLQITNGVDAAIAPRLIEIADSADRAEKSVGSLKSQLASIQSSGLGGLLTLLTSVKSETAAAATAQENLSAQVKVNTTVVNQNAVARREQAAAMRATAAEAKAILQSEADIRKAEIAGFLEAAEQEEARKLAWQNELIMQDQRIEKEFELKRAREQAALKSDIISRSAESAEQSAAAEKAAKAEAEAKLQAAAADAELTAASQYLAEQNEFEAAGYLQVAEATTELKAAKAGLSQLQKEIAAGDIEESRASTLLAAAMLRQAEATEQVQLAQTNLVEVQQYLASSEAEVINVTNGVTRSFNAAGASAERTVPAYVAASGALRTLEGRFNTNIRAAERFLTNTLQLGPVLQAAFPLIGAIAMAAVFYQMSKALVDVMDDAYAAGRLIKQAFDNATNSVRRTNDELRLQNDKLDASIARIQHKPTTNGIALAIDEARVEADKLDDTLEAIQKQFEQFSAKNQIGIIGGFLTGQAPTSAIAEKIAGDFQRGTDAAENAANKNLNEVIKASYKSETERQAAISAAQQLGFRVRADALKNFIAEEDKQLKTVSVEDLDGPKAAKGNEGRFNTIKGAIELAEAALTKLELSMQNIDKNRALDKLRDSTSELKNEARQAAAEWKALEADFVRFQEDSISKGHKPTAQEDLAFLRSRESTINPLNRDKLAAKELPFENKVAANNFIEEQTQKLKDSVGTIGLYDDALKEASEMNKLMEAAQRRGISVSLEQQLVWKELIVTIQENREYGRQLEEMYRSVADAGDVFGARLQALNKLSLDGTFTNEQYTQGLARVTRDYNEATDAVARYRRELDVSQANASNLLGTQEQIAVKTQLQSLDEQLRQSNVDAKHPFGYSEEEIQKVNEALAPLIRQQLEKNQIDQETNKLLTDQANLVQQLVIHEQALTAAEKAGALSHDAANAARLKDRIALNDSQLDSGNIKSAKQPYLGAIMDYAKQFKSIAAGIKDTFSGVFRTLADGFADTFGRAIAMGENLGTALKQVARDAIGQLISGLIKLGIQQILNLTLGTAAATAATAAGVAQATVLATAWAPAAFAASVATLGGADAIGGAAYATGVAAATALSAIPKFDKGIDRVPYDMIAMIHKDEAVLPAADNTAIREAVAGGGGRGSAHVEVYNYAGAAIDTEQMSDGRVRVIVRQMGKEIVSQHADEVVSNHIQNPNSRISKNISKNTDSRRNR